jgi:DUF2934 family protein
MARAKTPRTTKPQTEKKVLQMRDSNPQGNGANGSADSADLQSEIRQRAYELYKERGFADGYHEQDWLTAEREVRARHAEKHSA